MQRDVGAARAIQDALPEVALPIVVLITFLGASWFVGTVLAVVYWRTGDRDAVTAAGILAGAIGGYLSLKYVIAAPRPDVRPVSAGELSGGLETLYAEVVITDGYGLPSGHAVTATVAYLLLAELVPIGTRRQRYAVAVPIVGLVGLSRLAVGAHYLVDVVAGAAFGVGFLLAARRAASPRTDPTAAALALGAALALASVLASGGALDALWLASVLLPVGLWWALVGRPRHVAGAATPLAGRPLAVRAILVAATAVPVAVGAAYLGAI